MSGSPSRHDFLQLVTKIVTSYAVRHPMPTEALPDIIRSVYVTLSSLGGTTAATGPEAAVPLKRSIFPEYIICLEDGKKLKMLKRHLKTAYGLSPAQYRERWGLPPHYPMVAPGYRARRSAIARKMGLGSRDPGRRKQPAPAIQKAPEGVSSQRTVRKAAGD